MVTMRWWPPASGCAYRFLRDRNIKEHNEAHYRKEKKTLMSRKEAPLSLLPTYEAAQSEVINSASSLFSFSFCSTTRVPSVSKMSLSSSYLRKFFCLSVGAKGVPRRERERERERASRILSYPSSLFFWLLDRIRERKETSRRGLHECRWNSL